MSETLGDKAKEATDKTFGAGTSDKVEGQVRETVGNAQQAVGEATGDSDLKAHGETEELKGKTQQTVGEAKGKLEEFGEDVKEKFEHVASEIKESAGHLMDKIKDALDGDDKKPEEVKTEADKPVV